MPKIKTNCKNIPDLFTGMAMITKKYSFIVNVIRKLCP